MPFPLETRVLRGHAAEKAENLASVTVSSLVSLGDAAVSSHWMDSLTSSRLVELELVVAVMRWRLE